MKNVFLFYGDEIFLLEKKLLHWKNEFIKKHGEHNFAKFVIEKESDLKSAFDEIRQAPFLGEKRLVILDGLFSLNTEVLKHYIEEFKNIPDSALVILKEISTEKSVDKRTAFFKFLEKECNIEEFKRYNEKSEKEFCELLIRESNNSHLSFKVAAYIGEKLDYSLMDCVKLLEIISLYNCDNEVKIEHVDTFVKSRKAPVIFDLTDAISKKDSKKAIQILHTMNEQDVEMPMVFAMIHRQFRILAQVRDAMDRGVKSHALAVEIPEHPYTLKIASSQANNFTIDTIKSIYSELVKIDFNLKTGVIKISTNDHSELLTALELFCIKFAK